MRPAPREPSKQLNAKSLPATKRRAASGLRLSAQAEPAASKTKTTIANRVTIPNPPPITSNYATAARRTPANYRGSVLIQRRYFDMRPPASAVASNAQCEEFNHADPDHQHHKCHRIIVEPISLWVHDTPPGSRFISRADRQTGSNVAWKGRAWGPEVPCRAFCLFGTLARVPGLYLSLLPLSC